MLTFAVTCSAAYLGDEVLVQKAENDLADVLELLFDFLAVLFSVELNEQIRKMEVEENDSQISFHRARIFARWKKLLSRRIFGSRQHSCRQRTGGFAPRW